MRKIEVTDMSMKERIKIVDGKVKLPEKIKIAEIPRLTEALDKIWLDAVKKDYKRLSREDLYKKYDLKSPYALIKLVLDDTKKEEYKEWLESLKKKPKYID